jgi:tRNA(Ile)-lysidine synthase
MPAHWQRDGIQWHRPLLCVPGPSIRQWLADEKIEWIEDPSNADNAFTRNRIRNKLLPALAEAFPQFRETFSRSASHAAQAQQLLAEIAAQDLERIGAPPQIKALQGLSRARQANALRAWLHRDHAASASAGPTGGIARIRWRPAPPRPCHPDQGRPGLRAAAGRPLAWALEPAKPL